MLRWKEALTEVEELARSLAVLQETTGSNIPISSVGTPSYPKSIPTDLLLTNTPTTILPRMKRINVSFRVNVPYDDVLSPSSAEPRISHLNLSLFSENQN